ncbi:hypothetical protein PENCOP_c003G00997 [Penicillium coprophilum]|uniref:Extragenic suppressor of kinetochore protein 1 n=1 Tax=Penicillium coprophilum TaxID=36646 RepID=A0A1V6UYA1_9EURO|nr:hypothetical protein PENCOP_c003G00997 [Penicillium coprophilum]
MFWRFGGYANISTIDTLLDKPDITLEELLDEPEIIQELKQLNTKLIEYLREDHVLKRLMDYVIAPSLVNDDEENDEEDDAKDASKKDKDAAASADQTDTNEEKEGDPLRDILDPEDLDKVEKNRLKHAYIACEILSSETWSILESIMANSSYLRDFWGFLRRTPPLDSLQASYFTKVNETLLDKKTEEMLEFLKSLDGIVPALLQHVDNPMVMDLLLKIISLEKAEGGQGTVDWLKSQDLIPNLLCFLSPDRPASVQTSAGDFLKAIITISANASPNDQSCIGPNSLTRQLVSTRCVQQLIDAMLMGGNPLTVGVGIVIEVIRKNNSDYDPESLGGPDTMLTTYDPIYLGTLLRLFAKHIPQFMALIQSSQHTIHDGNKVKTVERGKLSSAWGGKIEPLGFDRFKTCELMAELLHCSNMGLLNEPGSDEYVKQRDEERERLIREGVFDPHRDENSGVDCNDTTADFVNDSAFDSGSPEDIKIAEVPHAGDEEGFEDVGASNDLVGAKAGADTTTTATSQPTETASEISSSKTTAAEPVSSEEITNPSQSSTAATADPSSPSIGLPDQVGSMNLGTDPQGEHKKPEKDNQEPVASPSQDVPAPLFTKEPTSESNPPPADQSEDASGATAQSEERSILNDGGDEDSAEQYIQLDTDGRPVVGDYLKIQFVENKVVPTILGFFFRFPWNNFLHNVVYDVIQQVFNGPMERGYNRALAVNVFDIGRITTAIVEGQKRSDETQQTKQIRLGYMGHLTLVAEEVVKFSERHPPELLSRAVMESVLNPDWIEYVEQTLSETRERDNAILGGVRPDMSGSRQASLNNTNSSQGFPNSNALSDAGLNGGMGGSNFQSFDLGQGSVSGGAFAGGGTSLLSGFASSSDDDEDEEMEDQDDRDPGKADQGDTDNVLTSSASQPIPILPPPPAPLSLGPSRARRQLAARLAAQKQQSSEDEEGDGEDKGAEKSADRGSDWPNNPFVIAGIDDDAEGGSSAFPNSDFGTANAKHSPTFPESGFSPPDSLSTNSSEDEGDGHAESVRRQVRVPLEVEDDDDEMGEMVGPSGIGMMDSDDEDEAIINESLGYSNLSGPGRYNNFRRTRAVSSHYDDEQNDSSDGEDDGLVEIVVPGRKSSTSN